MTKAQLQNLVNTNNKTIKDQRDIRICNLLYKVVDIQCKKNGWNPTQFFQEGGYENELQSASEGQGVCVPDERKRRLNRRVIGGDAGVEMLQRIRESGRTSESVPEKTTEFMQVF